MTIRMSFCRPGVPLLALVLILLFHPAQPCPATPNPPARIYEEPSLPRKLSLCDEPIPLEKREVLEMLDREVTIAAWDQAQVFMWLKRVGRYFPYIEKRLREEGLPDDLKYLAVAESSLILGIRSPKGALGTWQFMPATGRQHGLRKDRSIDERKDFERATDAALRYLKELHEMFQSWHLAMAAYNCGYARMKKEMEKQRAAGFFSLNLPRETERYIYRIAAIKLILENPEAYGYRIPEERVYSPVPADRVVAKVRSSIPIVDIAEALGTDFKTIKELNPHIQGYHMPTGTYYVRVPEGAGKRLAQVLKKMDGKYAKRTVDIDGDVYIVQAGDTLSQISRRSGVPISTIKELNDIRGSLICIGQRLKLKP